MQNFLSWILLGLIAGGLAKFIMPGKDPGGCLVTMLIGIVGAPIGGVIGRTLIGRSVTGLDLVSLGLAVVGSVILLALYRAILGRRRPRI